ncbi:septation protein IspZ [Sphingosinicellaceae bacterium]|nr:septation protein IspZ [Sphingosinicellaceae bacterium]
MLPPRKTIPAALRVALDYGPLLTFFVASKVFDIFVATAVFMVAIVLAIGVSRWKTGRISPMLWFTGAIVLVFGGATLWLGDVTFIKLKPTIIYLILAAILLFGMATGRPLLKLVLHDSFPAVDAEGWRKLTRNWALLFLGLAITNEVARRMLTTDQWVDFKVWGVTGLTFLFALSQAPILMRHAEDVPPKP